MKGFVLNKFRGDASLLAPGPEQLFARTGIPVVGVLPRVAHGLPDEDRGLPRPLPRAPTGPVRFRACVVAWPRISNFDEFRHMASWPGVELLPARAPSDLREADLLILPGSKNTPSDLAWLRERGLERAIVEFARSGRPVLGICGGMQALGLSIEDAFGNEGSAEGLGVLPLRTVHGSGKRVSRTEATLPPLDGFWRHLSGMRVAGYEIRSGSSSSGIPGGDLFSTSGSVLGTYLHGILEDSRVLAALFGGDALAPDPLEATFDMLAKLLDERMDMKTIGSWMDGSRNVPLVSTGSTSAAQTRAAGFESINQRSARLCVLTGGVRSGKSSTGERIAAEWGGRDVTYLATAQGLDDEMRERIRNHRSDRADRGWETIEEPLDAAGAIERARHPVVLLDCMTLLVTNLLFAGGADAVREGVSAILEAWERSGKDLVVVTNEVGLGIVPDNALSREYRDLLGWANQRIVARSTEAWMMVSGRKLSLQP